jgi:glycogen debranching enzyme
VLDYVTGLRRRSILPPQPPLPLPWENIGPGYCYGPAFGHWDIVHAILDVLPGNTAHALNQLRNNFANLQPDGFLPGAIWMRSEPVPWSTPEERKHKWNITAGHPPLWPVAAEALVTVTGDTAFLRECLEVARRQLSWFERERRAMPEGFFYSDILNRRWESGVDEGVRFDNAPRAPAACVDATSHVLMLYDHAARWAGRLGEESQALAARAAGLREFIRNEMFSEETGFFHDLWSVRDPSIRVLAFEGMWPMVAGAATPEQARRVVGENLLNPDRFFTEHPIATVARSERSFEKRMWRGPAWNSMTYWAAWGCQQAGDADAARSLAARALDATARVFSETGKIWEFYDSLGGDPREVRRKPHTSFNMPCPDYLGHNPLHALARLAA